MDRVAWKQALGFLTARSKKQNISSSLVSSGMVKQTSSWENVKIFLLYSSFFSSWWAAVYGVTQSWTQLKWLSSSNSHKFIKNIISCGTLSHHLHSSIFIASSIVVILPRHLFFFLFFFFGSAGSSLLCKSLIAASGGYSSCSVQASHCSSFSCCWAWALGAGASVIVAHGFCSCGFQALEHRFDSCGVWA